MVEQVDEVKDAARVFLKQAVVSMILLMVGESNNIPTSSILFQDILLRS